MQLRLRGAVILLALFACAASRPQPEAAKPGGYPDLVALFAEWRNFQKPRLLAGGVPDYTPDAMSAQMRELPSWQGRLKALDPRAWPIPQQVDFHIVRAEMNGLEFDHRVLQPWSSCGSTGLPSMPLPRQRSRRGCGRSRPCSGRRAAT